MMANQTMPGVTERNSLRKAVSVNVPPTAAWRVFTDKMSTWWPLATHKIGKAKAVDAVIEPHVGGRWYELDDDGNTCDWGRVLSWEPHSRLVLSSTAKAAGLACSRRLHALLRLRLLLALP